MGAGLTEGLNSVPWRGELYPPEIDRIMLTIEYNIGQSPADAPNPALNRQQQMVFHISLLGRRPLDDAGISCNQHNDPERDAVPREYGKVMMADKAQQSAHCQ